MITKPRQPIYQQPGKQRERERETKSSPFFPRLLTKKGRHNIEKQGGKTRE